LVTFDRVVARMKTLSGAERIKHSQDFSPSGA
jgi:hypothetical protein